MSTHNICFHREIKKMNILIIVLSGLSVVYHGSSFPDMVSNSISVTSVLISSPYQGGLMTLKAGIS